MILLARIVQIILSILSIKLSTHLLQPEQIGRLALANSVVAFFSFMFISPVGMFINRRLHAWWKNNHATKYAKFFAFYVVLVAIFSAVIFALLPFLVGGLHMSYFSLLALVSGSIAITTANMTLIPSLNLLGYVKPFACLSILTPLSGLVFSYYLCQYFRPTTEMWMTGLLIGQGLGAALGFFVFTKKMSVALNCEQQLVPHYRAEAKALVLYAWPIAIAAVLGWGQSQGYRLVMETQIGLKDLGVFVAAYGIALGLMSAIESLIASKLQPKFYKDLHDYGHTGAAEAWREYAGVAFPILTLTAGILAGAAWVAVHVFLSPTYWGTANYVAWAALIELARTSGNVYALAMHAEMKTSKLIFPSAVGAAASLGFLIVGAKSFGLSGVGPSLTLAGIAYVVTYHLCARKILAISIPWRKLGVALAGIFISVILIQIIKLFDSTSNVYFQIMLRGLPAAAAFVGFSWLIIFRTHESVRHPTTRNNEKA